MQLLGYAVSPFVRHALIVLQETQIECDFKQIDTHQAAELSPTKKVPLLKTNDVVLTDSTTIIRYLREKAGQPFLPDIQQHDLYCHVSTLLDSTVNVFLYERYGIEASDNGYFERQNARVEDGLHYLESLNLEKQQLDIDVYWRLACFLSWGTFRERIALDTRPRLAALLKAFSQDPMFEKTLPRSYGS